MLTPGEWVNLVTSGNSSMETPANETNPTMLTKPNTQDTDAYKTVGQPYGRQHRRAAPRRHGDYLRQHNRESPRPRDKGTLPETPSPCTAGHGTGTPVSQASGTIASLPLGQFIFFVVRPNYPWTLTFIDTFHSSYRPSTTDSPY